MTYTRLMAASAAAIAVALAAGACAKRQVTPTEPSGSCAVTLGSVPTNVGAAGTTGMLPVTAASSCAWTAQSSASFLSITSGATGTGNGSIGYSIAANTGAARSAGITVNGTSTNFAQAAATLLAPASCTVQLSSTNLKINSGGGTANVTVTADANCNWMATSNSPFLTATANAFGNGTVAVTATVNPGSARSGTVTIGGQTVTVSQDPGVFAAFDMIDPGQTSGPTRVCQFRGTSGVPAACTLRSTSFTQGAAPVVSFAWTVQYTYGAVKVATASGSNSTFQFSDVCGGSQATDDGALNPLDVTLTVTDSLGNTATATAGSGSQPGLFVQLFNCGK